MYLWYNYTLQEFVSDAGTIVTVPPPSDISRLRASSRYVSELPRARTRQADDGKTRAGTRAGTRTSRLRERSQCSLDGPQVRTCCLTHAVVRTCDVTEHAFVNILAYYVDIL